jgi:CubicO group peptidase (beta-lactamase class C family)
MKDVLKEGILNFIGADMEWGYDGTVEVPGDIQIRVNAGYAFTWWTARDLARIGYLYLNNGKWKEKQVLSREYVRETFTPIDLKINEYSPRQLEETDPEKKARRIKNLSKLRYGLGWWTRKAGFYNGWAMRGNGGQFCLIIPEYNLVMTKINDYTVKPHLGIGCFYPILMESIQKKGPSK